MKAAIASMLLVGATWLGGCGGGGGGSGNGGSGSCTPRSTASVAINASGFTPKAVCVLPGGSVTFMNADTVAHDIESGATCASLNLGPIAAGKSAVASFQTAETCSFVDAAHSADPAFQGTVAVSSGTTTGPGY